ncbi:hypothetical protein GGR22_000001 [Flavobacterium gossypii]|uniref:Uncharacterized protein n=2 Tax=Flavobacterium gossypii TaxID=1646119 RepID=A0ABR6DJL7_9FLAO|nr:hypothetical protein [Flavobacterium gossypii]MBA9071875.1 hypothetical protein [Flavobacterium gossypii]
MEAEVFSAPQEGNGEAARALPEKGPEKPERPAASVPEKAEILGRKHPKEDEKRRKAKHQPTILTYLGSVLIIEQ